MEEYKNEKKQEIKEKQNKNENYYEKSIDALIGYMKNNEQNPSQKKWDEFAIYNKYLSSKTIGYISGIGFNKLCRNLRKKINKTKRILKEENEKQLYY